MSCAGVEAGLKIDGVDDGPPAKLEAEAPLTMARKHSSAAHCSAHLAGPFTGCDCPVEFCLPQLADREHMGMRTDD